MAINHGGPARRSARSCEPLNFREPVFHTLG
jgi:hypothetical protein